MKLFQNKIVAMVLVALASACAGGEGEDFDRAAETDDPEVLAATIPIGGGAQTPAGTQTPAGAQSTGQQSVTLRDPKGLYFAKVVPAGAGCPAGTWNVRIAPDGEVFTATFSAYELRLDSKDAKASKSIDCTLNITLDSPAGLSYAVTSLYYSGFSIVTAGAQAEVQAYYSFSGAAIRTVNNGIIRTTKKTMTGPVNNEFVYQDDVATRDLVFSECGRSRTLNVTTALNLKRSQPSGEGYVNMAAIDGNTKAKLVFRLGTRSCTAR